MHVAQPRGYEAGRGWGSEREGWLECEERVGHPYKAMGRLEPRGLSYPLHDSPSPPSVVASCILPTVLDVMVYTVARYRVPSPTEMDEAALPVEDATDS